MALREEFRTHGNWLFHHRSYLPLLFLPVIFMEIRHFNPGQYDQLGLVWELTCLAISLLGFGIRIFTIGHVPRKTSGRNTTKQVADVLNTSGIYSVVRHPLYLGNFLMWLGIIVFIRSWLLDLVFILAYWLYYERIMYAEEEFLREKFGNLYTEWAAKTPAFLPNFSKWQPPNSPFSWRTAFNREYRGLCGIIFIFVFLKAMSDYMASGKLEQGGPWVEIFIGNILLYIIIYLLAKKTRVFHVEGR